MARTTFSGPVASDNGFITDITNTSTGAETFNASVSEVTMTGAGGTGGRSLFQLNADAALGSFSNALKGITVYGATGSTSGLGSAVVAELTLSAGTSTGTYAPLEIELNAPASASTGTRTSFIYASTQGDNVATIDTNGVFFNLQGLTAGAGKMLVAGATLGTAFGGLRVRVGSANYWVPLYAAQPTA